MRKSGFFPKMAWQSVRKNGKYYVPYFLTCIACAAMLYIMLYLNGNEGLYAIRGTAYVQTVLFLGAIVIGFFSAIVLFYTNSFLMKRRRKELGLFNILGMEKRHIGRVMLWETLITSVVGIVGGLIVGVLLSKLLLLLLCKLLKIGAAFGFEVSYPGMIYTAIVFLVIFFLNLLTNLRQVSKADPIELLRSGNTAEHEPKVKWPLTVLGLLAIGGGYYIALTVTNPIEALVLFFVAVMLVIIGTYFLFISGSIAVLKLLRRNKKYYYQTKHFISVSGMLHRMKRNAAGLASICILSTMVLVTVSSTLCLYIGSDDSLDRRFPRDIAVRYSDPKDGTVDAAVEEINKFSRAYGVEPIDLTVETSMEFSIRNENGKYVRQSEYDMTSDDYAIVYMIALDNYNDVTGNSAQLASGEALVQPMQSEEGIPQSFNLLGKDMTVKQYIKDFPIKGELSAYIAQLFFIVVNDDDMLELKDILDSTEGETHTTLDYRILFDVPLDVSGQSDYFDALSLDIDENVNGDYVMADGSTVRIEYEYQNSECRAQNEAEFNAMYGGFFFLGIFLGTLFLLATVLIIYYKQVSEGYEDAERFKIMQQVGLGEKEVRKSIQSQILTVFFLPLAAAGAHILAAFNMITKLLTIFSLYNTKLFGVCCLGTFLVFAIIYAAIYFLTARAYYKIVKA